MKRLLTVLVLLASPLIVSGQQFTPTKEPVHNGKRVTTDLPGWQHKRNVGGSDGAGLCVGTSIWHAAIWGNVRDLYNFRA